MQMFIDLFRLYIMDGKMKLARGISYRTDFIAGLLISLFFSCFGPLFQFLIFSKTNGFPGWNFEQMAVMQAVLLLWSGVTYLLMGDIWWLMPSLVQYGQFDSYLIKPYPPLAMLFTKGFSYRSIMTVLAGLAALTYTIVTGHFSVGWRQILLFSALFGAGLLLYMTMLIFFCAVTLRLVNTTRFKDILDRLTFFGSFPAEIYSHGLQAVYLIALPIALWVYFPAQALLGRLDWTALYGLLVSFGLFALSLWTWNYQIKKYTSAAG